jgi:hypothetical protein
MTKSNAEIRALVAGAKNYCGLPVAICAEREKGIDEADLMLTLQIVRAMQGSRISNDDPNLARIKRIVGSMFDLELALMRDGNYLIFNSDQCDDEGRDPWERWGVVAQNRFLEKLDVWPAHEAFLLSNGDWESRKEPWPHDMTTETFWRWLEASQKNEIVGIEPVFMPQFIANLFDDYRYIGEAILREAESNPERKALLEYAASVSCGSPFHWSDYVKKTEEADDLPF